MVQAQFLIIVSPFPDLHLGLATNQMCLTFKQTFQGNFLSASLWKCAAFIHKPNLGFGSCSRGHATTHSLAHTSPSISETVLSEVRPACSICPWSWQVWFLPPFCLGCVWSGGFYPEGRGLIWLVDSNFSSLFVEQITIQSLTTSHIRTLWSLWGSPVPSFGERGLLFPPQPSPDSLTVLSSFLLLSCLHLGARVLSVPVTKLCLSS